MLKGKWALVTGATAGLGLAVAESLAGAGANIVLHDLVEPQETRDRLRSRFDVEVVSVAADLSQRSSIETMMADLLGRLAAIDILVNNAVIRHFAPVEDFTPEHWEEALAVNLSAPFHLIRLALPAMKQRGWGRIINMASIYSTRAVANRIDYVTTKTAIVGMTRAVAIETTATGITCNAISMRSHRARCQHRPFRGKSLPSRPAKAVRSRRRPETISRHASRPDGSSPWRASAQWSSSCRAPLHRTSRGLCFRSMEAGLSHERKPTKSTGDVQWLKHPGKPLS